MKALSFLRSLTPVGWGLLLALFAITAVVLGQGLGLRWDPFGLTERRLETAEARAAAAASDTLARRLETEGLVEQARRLDQFHQQALAVERATAEATVQARSAHDASVSLDPARADRLARHDRELCRLAPVLCTAAAPGAAAGGDASVRAGPPA